MIQLIKLADVVEYVREEFSEMKAIHMSLSVFSHTKCKEFALPQVVSYIFI